MALFLSILPRRTAIPSGPPRARNTVTLLVGSCALAALLLGGCRPPAPLERVDEGALAASFEQLHRRVYDVYALPLDRDTIHGLLDSSFAGDALTDEYVEHYTTRVRMAREGTAIDVLRVDYEDVAVLEREEERVLVQADWSVGGVVTHQGHKHPRVNRYRAVFALAAADAGSSEPLDPASLDERLRIVETRLQRLERVKSAFEGGTGGFPLDDLPSSARGFLTARELLESGVLDELEAEEDEAEDGAAAAGEDSSEDPSPEGRR